jgi:hypothetical protein
VGQYHYHSQYAPQHHSHYMHAHNSPPPLQIQLPDYPHVPYPHPPPSDTIRRRTYGSMAHAAHLSQGMV